MHTNHRKMIQLAREAYSRLSGVDLGSRNYLGELFELATKEEVTT